MDEPPTKAAPKPCCVCDEPGGKHCTKCKSRHYCSKACQLVDWYERGHKAACKQLAAEFQDRLLDSLMPDKLKIKEAPAVVEDVSPAAGLKAAPRAPVVRTAAAAEVNAGALSDVTQKWRRGTCAICLDLLPFEGQVFLECCCKNICSACSNTCEGYDPRCPLCMTPHYETKAEWVRRLQAHVDTGNAVAQNSLGNAYRTGDMDLEQSIQRAVQLYELAAAQGNLKSQTSLAYCYLSGDGVKMNLKTALMWYRRAAEQGFPQAQFNLGIMFGGGTGVAQSHDEAVRWYRLAAEQGFSHALFHLGICYANGNGVPPNYREALRLIKCAAAEGSLDTEAPIEKLQGAIEKLRAMNR